ncbi:MAG: cellulose binding domain-containing protein [Oscillospiraceae bacterium]|nr:cellulose binding domain-containing protein [Oscillospiraceae bacterium]
MFLFKNSRANKLICVVLCVAVVGLIAVGCGNKKAAVEPPEPVMERVEGQSELGETPGNLTPETPENLTLEPPPLVVIDGQKFEWVVTSESDTEFHADIRIINLTRQAVDGWRLLFTGDFVITEIRNAKLIGSENSRHEVINEFWTKAINPHSSAIFSITAKKSAEKSAEKSAGSEPVLDNFVLVEFHQPEEPEIPAEMTAVTLQIFSELGYNVLLWGIDDATETYTVFRNGEEIASVSNQNFYLDTNVSENSTYEYYLVQTLDEIALQSSQVTITTTLAESHGISAREQISNLLSDTRTPIIFQETNSYRYVSRDLGLPAETENGSTITWHSSAEQIISPQGTVTRPTGGFFPVTLTSVGQNGEFEIRRKHNVNVAPLNSVEQREMTLDDLKEMNDGELPKISHYDDGTISRIQDTGNSEMRENNLSSFAVFSAEDARAVIDSYLAIFGIDDDIDIRFDELRSMSINIFRFDQYHNGIRIPGVGFAISTDKETGQVIIIGNGYITDLAIETTPTISIEEAKEIINSTFNFGVSESLEHELLIRYNNNTDVAELAWNIYTNHEEYRFVQVSAVTGEVLYINGGVIYG